MIKLDFDVAEIIEIYNSVPKVLTNKVAKVAVDPSRLSGDSKIPMLTEQKNGNYWIVLVEDDTYWLLPEHRIRINQFNLATVTSLFDCQEYQLSEHGDFILLQPAQVTIMPDGKEWRLDTKGILNFDPSYPAAEARARIQQARQEIDRLQSELAETRKQNEQLNARVAELAYDQLQKIRADLVTRDEFTAKSQQLDSLEQKLKSVISELLPIIDAIDDNRSRIKDITNQLQKKSQNYDERLGRSEKSDSENQSLSSRLDALQTQINSIILDRESLIKIQTKISQFSHDQSQIQNQYKQLTDNLHINQKQLGKIQNKLDELEENIRANNRLTPTTGNFSREFTESHEDVDRTSESDGPIESPTSISIEESNLARRYNHNRDFFSLLQQTPEVNATEDSLTELRIDSTSKVIFEIKRRGNYWIVRENGNDYLVPSNNLRLNQHNYKTVEALFECINFKLNSNFQLVKPARVSALPGGETWQLEERGILQF